MLPTRGAPGICFRGVLGEAVKSNQCVEMVLPEENNVLFTTVARHEKERAAPTRTRTMLSLATAK